MMRNRIKTFYLIHHSHTDIGYTDLQEQVVYNHINNIRQAVSIIRYGIEHNTPEKDFVWNCETYYCVERFLEAASEEEKEQFFELVRRGNIGLSGTYLNFNDLADRDALFRRTAAMQKTCTEYGAPVKAAMNADINGISMGGRDALIENGIAFLYTNIHTHHGMYPLYKNQVPYWWEAENGKQLLVWSGEHYNLGNALGLNSNTNVSFHPNEPFFKTDAENEEYLNNLHENIERRLCAYEADGYPYDFAVTSISGVFSDNAPPNPALIYNVNAYNARFGDEVTLKMVTVEQFYEAIRDKIADAPVYRGDLNDWWANGVGSTPYAVKHYKEAQRLSHICDRLEEKTGVHNAKLADTADENMLLYAEHTWGHSSTIGNPYDTMVLNLDMRNNSYASKAHEASAMRKNEQCHLLGDKLSYYNTHGRVKVINLGRTSGKRPVEFYVETGLMKRVRVIDEKTGEELKTQISSHPRGQLVSCIAFFEAGEEKIFSYEMLPAEKTYLADNFVYSSEPYVGQERIRDIVNGKIDTETVMLPYSIENNWFRISYRIGEGITSFYDKQSGRELLCSGESAFFTPLYENTEIRRDTYEDRRRIGRNIRGQHAKLYQGELSDVEVLDQGAVFVTVKLTFKLEGTYHSAVIIKLYRDLPKFTFKYQIAKTLSEDIESVFLPLSLNLPEAERFITKGGAAMRPGIDQLPGTCKEYYIADNGVAYCTAEASYLVGTLDTPLLYQGEMQHHPVTLCTNDPADNRRPLYSWIMNNTWETNFKMDLSGFCEFCYSFERVEGAGGKEALDLLADSDLGEVAFIYDKE
ncbi:MAG: hypothetical protein SOR38_10345 [Oscillospiraceae bacterium]|nr:hypothetical protein [Oscillospiraceae bacterium]MDY3066182.1 hypothetical protein [Oscillospiraceae bacterium]